MKKIKKKRKRKMKQRRKVMCTPLNNLKNLLEMRWLIYKGVCKSST
jgi:hypothetical protein